MHILVTGGCGYIGTVLVQDLLGAGHKVKVIDTEWFGNHLPSHNDLKVESIDVRNIGQTSLKDIDTVIHLANIANDPSVELDPVLSWEVNVLAAYQLADRAQRDGVKQIIYASSGSVYGVKDEEKVTEDLELVPISAYNKTKMVAERVLLSFKDSIAIHCIRPATVCGYSPSIRLDVSVNMLTYQAVAQGEVIVHGGAQTRPNIHINDISRVFQHFLTSPHLPSGSYNAGFENMAIAEIAALISERTNSKIRQTASNDPRSYRQDSSKLLATGFQPQHSVSEAVDELIHHFSGATSFSATDSCYRVGTLTALIKSGQIKGSGRVTP